MITPERLAASGSESGHQQAIFCWANQNVVNFPQLKYLFSIPNGGARDKITAAKLKAEGVKAGIPDMFLPVACGMYHGLFIELKVNKNVATSEQKKWIEVLNENGYYATVCRGWEEARECLLWYLRLTK